jgi:carboxypeptidase T
MVKYAQDMMTPTGPGLGVYHTYQQIMDSTATIAINNPTICHLDTLGQSPTGKYLVALKITQNPTQENHRPRMLWDGTTHGNENIGTEACWYFMQQLVGRYGSDPLITQLVNTREIWIVPCVNPEGLISRQRANSNGIDLNRENGYAWDNASGADEPFSQPEIQAMRRLFQREHFTLHLTYHSGATVAMWVWGWTDQQPRDVSIMSDQVTRYANTCGYDYGMISNVMYFAPGGSTDYYYGCEGALAYAAEISGGQPPPQGAQQPQPQQQSEPQRPAEPETPRPAMPEPQQRTARPEKPPPVRRDMPPAEHQPLDGVFAP